MAEDGTRDLIEGMLAQLESQKMAGLSIDDLRDAMRAPGAAETVAELMPIEAASVQPGEPAPDFELMPLRFYDFAIDRGITKANAGSLFEPVKLSAFRGNLPVVLIFGSFT